MNQQRTLEGIQGRPEAGVYTREQPLPEDPRIYVVPTDDLQRGIDHGAWIPANQDPKRLEGDVLQLLRSSPSTWGSGAWEIHGYSGFGGIELDRQENLTHVSRIARDIVRHGRAYSSWATFVERDPELLAHFSDHYLGSWTSEEAFARAFAEDVGLTDFEIQVADKWRPYVRIDYQALLREVLRPGTVVLRHHDDIVSAFLAPLEATPAAAEQLDPGTSRESVDA